MQRRAYRPKPEHDGSLNSPSAHVDHESWLRVAEWIELARDEGSNVIVLIGMRGEPPVIDVADLVQDVCHVGRLSCLSFRARKRLTPAF
jgi:hypothetical protein